MPKRPIKWVIAYIDSSKIHLLERDLGRHRKYRLVRVYIPKVKVLKKKFKGKEYFDEVPLLFNYGFFEVPEYFIPNPHFLEQMQKDIECIYAWVKDPAVDIQLNSRLSYRQNPKALALTDAETIYNLALEQEEKSIYSSKDVQKLVPGKIITLAGYPFDGLDAEVIQVDEKRKEVEVRLLLGNLTNKIKVSFDNVFYTIYKSEYMNTSMKETSLEDIEEKRKNIDSLFTKISYNES